VNPFNPCAPCSFRVSLCFPCFLSSYNGIWYDNMNSSHWNEQIGLLYLQNFMNSPWQVICSPWRVASGTLCLYSHWTRLHARLASWLFSQILIFLSFLVSWHSIPAQMDRVRYKKRNRAIVHLFLGFSLNNLQGK